MKVSEIPKALYEEFSAKFGKGEERRSCGLTKWRHMRDLEPTDFRGAMSYEEIHECGQTLLSCTVQVCDPGMTAADRLEPILGISVQFKDGPGQLTKEALRVVLYDHLSVANPIIPFFFSVITRARELLAAAENG